MYRFDAHTVRGARLRGSFCLRFNRRVPYDAFSRKHTKDLIGHAFSNGGVAVFYWMAGYNPDEKHWKIVSRNPTLISKPLHLEGKSWLQKPNLTNQAGCESLPMPANVEALTAPSMVLKGTASS